MNVVVPQTLGPYVLQHMVGRGGFSHVYSAIHEPTGTLVAIKIIPRSRVASEKFARELVLMKKLDHPFIVALYDFIEDSNNYYLVMEFCSHGTLLDRVTGSPGLPESFIKCVICELISALDYLHNEVRIAHRDVKLENIMLDNNDHIRLIDFGLGRQFSGASDVLQTACGSPVYASPEMVTGKPYGTACDVWSAGVVLYAMVYGRPPFQATNLQRLAAMICDDEPEYSDRASPTLIDLMKRMLAKDVDLRITVRQMRMHAWLFGDARMKAFGPRFGIDEGWRSKDGKIVVDEKTLARVADGEKTREELLASQFNARTAVYRMIRRAEIANAIAEMRFDTKVSAIPRPTCGATPPEVRNLLDKMKENQVLPPLNRTPRMNSTKLGKEFGHRAVKSMNPRQTHAVHQCALSIMSQLANVKRRTRALSTTASEGAPPIIVSRPPSAQMT